MEAFFQTFFVMIAIFTGLTWLALAAWVIFSEPQDSRQPPKNVVLYLVLVGLACAVSAGAVNYFAVNR